MWCHFGPISCFDLVQQFPVVGSINHPLFMEKFNIRNSSVPRKRWQEPCPQTTYFLPYWSGFIFWMPFHTGLLCFRDIMVHPWLITGQNGLQKSPSASYWVKSLLRNFSSYGLLMCIHLWIPLCRDILKLQLVLNSELHTVMAYPNFCTNFVHCYQPVTFTKVTNFTNFVWHYSGFQSCIQISKILYVFTVTRKRPNHK